MYAILDIETTGGQYNEEGITEIAIYKYDGNQLVDQFQSLVNPEKEIQPFVVKLTGINNAMLRLAPKFYEVAKRIIEMTEGCVIVAHNAEFDYRILRTEFRRLGYDFVKETLCTVELSQKLLPDMPSYSLGKLVRSLGIPITDRHRAGGDAMATYKLFELLLSKDKEKAILTSMIKSDIKQGLNPKYLDIVENVPPSVGIYYIHDQDGQIIYIGKSTNMKKKVLQHFTSNSSTNKKIQNETFTVTFEKTGNELVALLKETEEVSINKPKYNRLTKKNIFAYSLYLKTNIDGFLYLSIEKTDGRKRNIMAFTSISEGRKFVNRVFQSFDQEYFTDVLFEKKSKKHTPDTFSAKLDIDYATYNTALLALLEGYKIDIKNLMVVDKGRKIEEKSAVFLQEGKVTGYCFFGLNYQINAPERIAANLIPITFNRTHRNIVLHYLNKKSSYKLIQF